MVKKIDIVIFDLDSTLVKIEGFMWLASEVTHDELKLFSSSLDGKVALHEALNKDLNLLAPTYMDIRWGENIRNP